MPIPSELVVNCVVTPGSSPYIVIVYNTLYGTTIEPSADRELIDRTVPAFGTIISTSIEFVQNGMTCDEARLVSNRFVNVVTIELFEAASKADVIPY